MFEEIHQSPKSPLLDLIPSTIGHIFFAVWFVFNLDGLIFILCRNGKKFTVLVIFILTSFLACLIWYSCSLIFLFYHGNLLVFIEPVLPWESFGIYRAWISIISILFSFRRTSSEANELAFGEWTCRRKDRKCHQKGLEDNEENSRQGLINACSISDEEENCS